MNSLYEPMCEEQRYPLDYGEVFSQMEKLEKKVCKLKKKKKSAPKKKKQKLKRRIRRLELEQEQMRQAIVYLAYQCQVQTNQQPWWQSAICSTMPKVLELATTTINRLPPKAQPLCITDGSDRK